MYEFIQQLFIQQVIIESSYVSGMVLAAGERAVSEQDGRKTCPPGLWILV